MQKPKLGKTCLNFSHLARKQEFHLICTCLLNSNLCIFLFFPYLPSSECICHKGRIPPTPHPPTPGPRPLRSTGRARNSQRRGGGGRGPCVPWCCSQSPRGWLPKGNTSHGLYSHGVCHSDAASVTSRCWVQFHRCAKQGL